MPLQEFGTEREKPVFNSNIKKAKFLDLNTTATIRILSERYYSDYTHFMNRATTLCLGDECPICNSNKRLIMQYPDTFRDEPLYSPRREVRLVNVIDKTPVRICDNCQTENRSLGNTSTTCKKCSAILTGTPAPLNQVRILSRGVTLFEDLGNINKAVLDAHGEKVGLTNYDITLVISGSGNKKTITPLPGQTTGPETVNPDDLFELDTVTIKLSPSEMIDLQRGVSLKDIFSARRASDKSAELDKQFVSPEVLSGIQDDVDALFAKP